MTNKQLFKEKKNVKNEILDLKISLAFSIKLLDDYRGDLKIELSDLNKTIKRANTKLKSLDSKLEGLK